MLFRSAVFAALAAGAITRALHVTWLPAIGTAIEHLPDRGEIRDGWLVWPNRDALTLVDGSFLAILVRPQTAGQGGQTADVQFEFGATNLTVSSVFGLVNLPYPRACGMALNRPELAPLWGAWRPHVVAALFIGGTLALLLLWLSLGLLLSLVLRTYAWLLEREAGVGGCWRVATASLLPTALVLATAATLYGTGRLSAGEFLLLLTMQVPVALVYLLLAPLKLPKPALVLAEAKPDDPAAPANPFAPNRGDAEHHSQPPNPPTATAARG